MPWQTDLAGIGDLAGVYEAMALEVSMSPDAAVLLVELLAPPDSTPCV